MSLACLGDRTSRIHDAVLRHHANTTATFNGGAPFGVLFDRAGQDRFDGALAATAFTAAFCVSNAPGLAEGSTLVVGGVAYAVAGPVEPDAGGWVSVALALK